MSNYLSRTQKKRDRQRRLENDLRRLVAVGAGLEVLIVAAEEVRAARIRTVKADRQHRWAIGSNAPYDAEIAALEAMEAGVILSEFTSLPSGVPL